MGTGVGGLSLEEASKIMVSQIKKHIDLRTSLKKIVLVGFSDELTLASKNAIDKVLLNAKRRVFFFKKKLLNAS